jgi:hypothetical protein
MANFGQYLAALGDSVLHDWTPRESKRLRATINHLVGFSTWESLNAQGLGQKAMVDLVTPWIEASLSATRRAAP